VRKMCIYIVIVAVIGVLRMEKAPSYLNKKSKQKLPSVRTIFFDFYTRCYIHINLRNCRITEILSYDL
jgi:hypothetical protein